MVVQHNLTAMNSNRMLGITTKSQAKSTEKLSSGYKINRAADDAAGLAISEKMRKQIRGLTQASLNAQDGISAVQTAEGALTEVHDMLQRMNELAVKASNGTLSETDRQNVQDEVNAIVKEIDRVSETTKFNEIYLLKGGNGNDGNKVTAKASAKIGTFNGGSIIAGADGTIANGDSFNLGKVGLVSDNVAMVKNTLGTNSNGTKQQGAANTAAANNLASITVTKADADKTKATFEVTETDGTKISMTSADLEAKYGVTLETTAGTNLGDTVNFNKALLGGAAAVGGALAATITGTVDVNQYNVGDDVAVKANVASDGTVTFGSTLANPLLFNLHVGADSYANNKISVSIKSMDAKTLGVETDAGALSVSTEKDATTAIDKIATAIANVSRQRSELGAVQNRLEHTINNLDNVVENTTSAESLIRDTDMATEMVKYSNNNILAQAGQAMLAQANQSNQGVLSLLG